MQLAEIRRNAPVETARRFREAYAEEVEALDSNLKRDEEVRLSRAKATELSFVEVDRLDEVRQNWQQSSEELLAFRSGLEHTIRNMDKAQKAVEYVAQNR